MSWIKQANKIGKYESTRMGFRIYWKKEPTHKSYPHVRNGVEGIRTDFIKGELVAIDKTGLRIEEDSLGSIGFKIDMEIVRRNFCKRYKEEIVWY